MIADGTEHGQTEQTEPEINSGDQSYLGTRQANRAPVRLSLSIGTRDHAYLAESVDISETGILIDHYTGPELGVGMRVRALIRGIISDADSNEQLTTMYVARCMGRQVAFTFFREQSSKTRVGRR